MLSGLLPQTGSLKRLFLFTGSPPGAGPVTLTGNYRDLRLVMELEAVAGSVACRCRQWKAREIEVLGPNVISFPQCPQDLAGLSISLVLNCSVTTGDENPLQSYHGGSLALYASSFYVHNIYFFLLLHLFWLSEIRFLPNIQSQLTIMMKCHSHLVCQSCPQTVHFIPCYHADWFKLL